MAVFFAVALYQPLGGNLEMWPFSYFGMYKGRVKPRDFIKVLVEYTEPGKAPLNVVEGRNGYYVCEKIRDIVTGTVTDYNNSSLVYSTNISLDEARREEVRRIVKLDALTMLREKQWLERQAIVSVRVLKWNFFKTENLSKPDFETVVYSGTVGELL